MTVPVIQELTIDARGAAAGSALYVKAMQTAQAAVDRLLDRDRLQQEQQRAGVPVTEQAAQSTSRLAAAFDKLRGSVDPATKMQITHQREIERAMLTTDSAVRRGLATQESAAKLISQIRARQLGEVQALTAAEQRHNSVQAAGLRGANDNRSGGGLNTANIAAQFQDIGVTAAMGMSPLQIALQQGTQLSAVLGGQGLTGVVKNLGAAFLSIINPVSLLTIGTVALAAAGIQWIGGLISNSAKAEDALARHRKWLDDLLFGYDAAKKAATDAADAAKKLPEGVVASDIRKSLKDQAAAADDFAASLRRVQNQADSIASTMELGAGISRSVGAPDGATEGLIAQLRLMQDFSVDTKMTSREIETLMTTVRELFNTTDNPAIKELASDFFELADRARQSKAETEAQEDALRRLQTIGNININLSIQSNVDTALSGMEKLKALTPDLRTEYQKVDDALSETMLANSNLPAMLRQTLNAGAQQAASAAKAALDLQAAQQEAAKAAAAGTKESDKLADAYTNVVSGAKERIAQAQIEAQALGMTEAAAAKLRYAHELLNAAQQAGIVLDKKQRDELVDYASRAVEAEMRTRALTKAHEEQARQITQATDVVAAALGSLFSKPITDAREFFSTVLGGFAQLGQSNLKSSLQNLLMPSAANDNGGGNAGSWVNAQANVFGKAVKDGAKEGTLGGFGDFVKAIPGGAGTVSAGLGGLGIGYQTANPLMGAAGGARAGMSAGPIGAVVGGIAGLIGGLIGMNEELQKAKKALGENKQSIEAFIGAGYGDEIDETTAAVLQYKAQAAEYIKLAEAAGDQALVKRLKDAAAAYRDTLRNQQAIAQIEDRVAERRDALREAYERESAALQDTIDRNKAFIESIQQFKDSLLLNSSLSPLSPQDRLLEAQMQFQQISQAAIGGDANAQAQLQAAAQAYLEQARNMYASSEGYTAIFAQVQAVLDQAIAGAQGQISDAERQLEKMTEQVSKLIDINTNVVSVAQAIKDLKKENALLQAAQLKASEGLRVDIKALIRELQQQNARRAA